MVGTLTSTDLLPGSFSMVFMNHVIEHLPDVEASLARCLALLESGGRLVLVYPNRDALTTVHHKQYSPVWDPPRHLVLAPPKAMVALLERIGFSRVNATTVSGMALVYRLVARQYEKGRQGRGFETTGIGVRDRMFAGWEWLRVKTGSPLGEEIVVVAYRA
jgi:hypothetical protein